MHKNVYVIEETLSRAPHTLLDLPWNDTKVPLVDINNTITGYDDSFPYGPAMKVLCHKWLNEQKQHTKLEKLLWRFTLEAWNQKYQDKICGPGNLLPTLPETTYGSERHKRFKIVMTLASLDNDHWHHMNLDI